MILKRTFFHQWIVYISSTWGLEWSWDPIDVKNILNEDEAIHSDSVSELLAKFNFLYLFHFGKNKELLESKYEPWVRIELAFLWRSIFLPNGEAILLVCDSPPLTKRSPTKVFCSPHTTIDSDYILSNRRFENSLTAYRWDITISWGINRHQVM